MPRLEPWTLPPTILDHVVTVSAVANGTLIVVLVCDIVAIIISAI